MEYIPVPPDESASNVDDELQPVKDTPTGSGSFRRNSITGPQQLSPELASSDSGITMEHPLSATLHVYSVYLTVTCRSKNQKS